MPSLLSPIERQQATADRELSRRRREQLGRYVQRIDISSAQRAEAEVQIDECERECAMLGVLLEQRTGWTMARNASEHDSPEARPYQAVAPWR